MRKRNAFESRRASKKNGLLTSRKLKSGSINTGEAFVGNIGSEKRRIRLSVILLTASRIESCKIYKTKFLISTSTYQLVREIADVIKISEVKIRGKAKSTNIYEILNIVENKIITRRKFFNVIYRKRPFYA